MNELNPINIYLKMAAAVFSPWRYAGMDWSADFWLSGLFKNTVDCFSRKGLLKNLISSPE